MPHEKHVDVDGNVTVVHDDTLVEGTEREEVPSTVTRGDARQAPQRGPDTMAVPNSSFASRRKMQTKQVKQDEATEKGAVVKGDTGAAEGDKRAR